MALISPQQAAATGPAITFGAVTASDTFRPAERGVLLFRTAGTAANITFVVPGTNDLGQSQPDPVIAMGATDNRAVTTAQYVRYADSATGLVTYTTKLADGPHRRLHRHLARAPARVPGHAGTAQHTGAVPRQPIKELNMSRYVYEGKSNVYWATSIANKNAPTVAEITAAVALTNFVAKDGVAVNITTNNVDSATIAETFDAQLVGSYGRDLQVTMFRDDTADTAWNLCVYGTNGYLVIDRVRASGALPSRWQQGRGVPGADARAGDGELGGQLAGAVHREVRCHRGRRRRRPRSRSPMGKAPKTASIDDILAVAENPEYVRVATASVLLRQDLVARHERARSRPAGGNRNRRPAERDAAGSPPGRPSCATSKPRSRRPRSSSGSGRSARRRGRTCCAPIRRPRLRPGNEPDSTTTPRRSRSPPSPHPASSRR